MHISSAPEIPGIPSIPEVLREFGFGIAAFDDSSVGGCCRVGSNRVDDLLWQVDVEYSLDEGSPAVALTQTTRPINARTGNSDPSSLLKNGLLHFAATFEGVEVSPDAIQTHDAQLTIDGRLVPGITASVGRVTGFAATLPNQVVVVSIAPTSSNHDLVLSAA